MICDDRSTDATAEIAHAFARTAPFPVRFTVNPTRLGFGENFLQAAVRCEGDLIAFCDQDDVWHAVKLERCARAFADPRVALAAHAGVVVDRDLQPSAARHPDIARSLTVARHAPSPWLDLPGFAMVFRRQLLHPELMPVRPRSRWSSGPMHHDEWIWLWARLSGATRLEAEPLVSYRQHAGNSAGAPDADLRDRVAIAMRTPSSTYAEFATLAAAYAAFLRDAADVLPGRRTDLARGEALYASVAGHAHARSRLYAAAGRGARLRRLGVLVRRGAYRPPAHGGLGLRPALKDATLGLARPISASMSSR